MSAPTQEVILNLHRSQAKFLQRLAAATELEPSIVCQRLIDLAVRSDPDWQNDLLYSSTVQKQMKGLSRVSGGGGWAQIPIALDAAHFEGLEVFAARSGASNSKAMRHLLAACMAKFSIASGKRQLSRRSHSGPLAFLGNHSIVAVGTAVVALCAILSGLGILALREGPSVKVGPHWAGNEAGLILDPHTHSNFSDGDLSTTELVGLAVENGCDALAITDHSEADGAVSDAQWLELQSLREEYPDLLLFNGVELNMPSYGGREHAGLIADPLIGIEILQKLRNVAERGIRKTSNVGASQTADKQLLQAIADHQSLQNGLLLVYNHPTKKDPSLSENIADLERWNELSQVFTVIEGGPGRQNAFAVGDYEEPYLTEDGWDPAVANIGGMWDQWLSRGQQLWGALASSDYHNSRMDKAPCAFSRTHLIVPEQSYRGVLMALRSGTFWSDHGRILNQLWFSLEVDSLGQAAYPGYTAYLGDRDSQGLLKLVIERGPGSAGLPLQVEFIGDCRSSESELLAVEEIAADSDAISAVVPLAATGDDGKSCTVRARVRLSRANAPDYLAYTNPIRLLLD